MPGCYWSGAEARVVAIALASSALFSLARSGCSVCLVVGRGLTMCSGCEQCLLYGWQGSSALRRPASWARRRRARRRLRPRTATRCRPPSCPTPFLTSATAAEAAQCAPAAPPAAVEQLACWRMQTQGMGMHTAVQPMDQRRSFPASSRRVPRALFHCSAYAANGGMHADRPAVDCILISTNVERASQAHWLSTLTVSMHARKQQPSSSMCSSQGALQR